MGSSLMLVLAQAEVYRQPEQWGYVLTGWALCVLGFVAYTVSLVVRSRRLARQVPPEERRWMS
jgi:Na+/melibiose symporter-like transporter